MISEDKIQEATKRLVEAYNPVAIYLFGSYAWGEPNEDSDLDFYILLSDDAEMRWDAFRIGTFALDKAKVDFATDILVDKYQSFIHRSQHPSSLEYKIKKNGIRVYRTTEGMAAKS